MKKTKLVFYGVMSMILMGAGAANAAQIASKEYVDTGLATKANTADITTAFENLDLGKLSHNDSVATEDIDDAAVTKPKLSLDVQTTLDKADTALQSADLTDYAKTTDVNTALGTKADQATTYTKTEVDTALTGKADTSTTYTKTEVDTALTTKANTADVTSALSTKADTTYVDTGLAAKADQATTYTKTEVDTALTTKANTADVTTALAEKEDVANKSNDINADTGSTTKYPTVSAVENRIYEVEDYSDATYENLANKSTDISADTGSTKKYPTVSAVETYSIPKPSATCLGAQSQCVLSINKTNGSIYWEDVAMLPEAPQYD